MHRFLRNRDAHTAIEYSMIAALIAIGIIAAITSIGGSVADMFAKLLPAFAEKA
ncbi:MAG: Flp family type IVb pilin [Hyphomonadaceae bacterium]|nr:Flp family type IVb pilin [Hyphomonadaceae bacterium]